MKMRLEFNDRQTAKIADIFSDFSQVFFASMVLPAIGFGGDVSVFSGSVGGAAMLILAYFSLLILRSPRTHGNS